MRLINCSTLEFEEFLGRSIPDYAILSHTWEAHEISFKDYCSAGKKLKKLKGSAKILSTCEQALKDKLHYAWVDTCCIDKSSSAELSEAINSMFKWYKKSKCCYAYLSDYDSKDDSSQLKHCRWFSRGWTLQELLAPHDVFFYDKNWKCFGSKQNNLIDQLAAITEIDRFVLHGHSMKDTSVAEKMSWVARRETTREEDIAYCLFGIFGVNLPLLYGEGSNAFIRLQEEIMKQTDDTTLFAWQADSPKSMRGILARSPAHFVRGKVLDFDPEARMETPEFAMTNKGLRIQTLVKRVGNDGLIMSLHRSRKYGEMSSNRYMVHVHTGIYLVERQGRIWRDRPHQLASEEDDGTWSMELLYISK
ncbi:heterokaryon incompatibility protein-domain-containing protein [Massariosphaeria phaeospora]|uniref:Heterokaryon incompatibility protein-domain-containing protein n=1 Tax=Massariosphaeria phaeospora TaxID=100035 RepID=A0A7C8M9D9_9PLEO|nr:heterokaryon incompatibility protein-domain-containing protein [Massariosphaeria phaeospora]